MKIIMLWQLCLALFAIWMAMKRWKNRKLIKLSKQLKTDAICLPFVGHAYKFIGNDEVQMKTFISLGEEAVREGGMSSIWIGDLLAVVIADPVVGEVVLKAFADKGEIIRYIRDVIGNGSIFAPVEVWRPRRKVMAQAFRPNTLNQFFNVFVQQSSIMACEIESRVGPKPFSVWNYVTSYTLDSVGESALGVEMGAQKNHNLKFLKLFEVGIQLVVDRILFPWLHIDVIYKLLPAYQTLKTCKEFLYGFIDDIIKSKRKELENSKLNIKKGTKQKIPQTNLKTFLELLIEYSGGERGYSDLELVEELVVLVMAGNDTTAVALSFAILMMARYPDVQQKIYEELQQVFGDSARPIDLKDLPRLKYTDAVVRETLRLYPPAPLVLRFCDRDYTMPSGVTFAKGSQLLVHIFAIQRNPEYWGEDAEEFRPERFLDTPFKHPAQFMAFGYGSRNCLGYQYAMMSMKTALSTILRRYRVMPCARAHEALRLKYGIMMKDADNFTVQIQKRV